MNTSTLSRHIKKNILVATRDVPCYPCFLNSVCWLSLRSMLCELGVICCRQAPWAIHSSVCEVSPVVWKTPQAMCYSSGKPRSLQQTTKHNSD